MRRSSLFLVLLLSLLLSGCSGTTGLLARGASRNCRRRSGDICGYRSAGRRGRQPWLWLRTIRLQ